MRLARILEGWRLQNGAINPDQVREIMYNKNTSGNPKNKELPVDLTAAIAERFQYLDEDDIFDFIKIKPFNKAKRLCKLLPLPRTHSLESFADSRIYYGFRFVPSNDYFDDFASGLMPDDKILEKYFHKIKYAFVKMLKHPESKEAKAMQAKFIQMAAENFVTKIDSGGYDIITYPQSSSTFNDQLARAIAEYSGGEVFPGFDKLPAKDVTINQQAMHRRYDPPSDDLPVEGRVKRPREYNDLETQRHLNNQRDIKRGIQPRNFTDAEREIAKEQGNLDGIIKTKSDQPIDIKDIKHGDKRRYYNMFKRALSPSFEGKRVLVVDDNLVHQGTMELIHALATQEHPAKIDLYTPLFIND